MSEEMHVFFTLLSHEINAADEHCVAEPETIVTPSTLSAQDLADFIRVLNNVPYPPPKSRL